MTAKRAAAYVRLSKHRGIDDPSTSPVRQREACQAYADAQGWELVEVFEDLDVSAGEDGLRLDRPGLVQIRERFADLDVVIFLKIDRLARSVVDFSTFASEAAAAGVALVSVRDGLDLSTPGGRFVAQILSAFAEMELATITERVRDGKRKSRELGRWPGGMMPYGFRLGADGRLEPDEAERVALQGAADVILSGGSQLAAARMLTASGLRPRRADRWTLRTVRRMLTSDLAAESLGAERAHLLKEALAPQPDVRTSNPSRLLSGLLRCHGCGSPMYASKATKYVTTYRCSRTATGGGCPASSTISAAPIDSWIEGQYLEALGDHSETVTVRVADERVVRIAELTASTSERAALLGTLRGADLRQAVDDLEREEAELAELRDRRGGGLTVLRETGRTNREAWEAASDLERREIIRRTFAPSGFLTVGPGRPGVRGFQPERLLDGWKVVRP
jgi:site-specific DNA recombinase